MNLQIGVVASCNSTLGWNQVSHDIFTEIVLQHVNFQLPGWIIDKTKDPLTSQFFSGFAMCLIYPYNLYQRYHSQMHCISNFCCTLNHLQQWLRLSRFSTRTSQPLGRWSIWSAWVQHSAFDEPTRWDGKFHHLKMYFLLANDGFPGSYVSLPEGGWRLLWCFGKLNQ